MEASRLAWSDVEPLAREIFRIWSSGGDFAWAGTAWVMLAEAGLTLRQEDPVEDVRTLSRLVALGLFYHTFAHLGFEEPPAEPFEWMTGYPTLTDIEILRRLSPEWHEHFGTALSNPAQSSGRERRLARRTFLGLAWEELLETEYPAVVKALERGFGGESELFVSLWCSPANRFPGWRTFPPEVRDAVLNQDGEMGGKPAAFAWLSEGAQYVASW